MEQHDSSSESASTTTSQTPCVTTATGCRCDNEYKLCTLVSKCLRRTAPSYLADTCIFVSSTAGRQHLCSAAHHDLTIPRSRLARYGSRSFANSGFSLWNSLPFTIRDSTLTFAGFCSTLKTELYNRAYGGYTVPS